MTRASEESDDAAPMSLLAVARRLKSPAEARVARVAKVRAKVVNFMLLVGGREYYLDPERCNLSRIGDSERRMFTGDASRSFPNAIGSSSAPYL